jgi:hypothetical protein
MHFASPLPACVKPRSPARRRGDDWDSGLFKGLPTCAHPDHSFVRTVGAVGCCSASHHPSWTKPRSRRRVSWIDGSSGKDLQREVRVVSMSVCREVHPHTSHTHTFAPNAENIVCEVR